MALNAAPRSHGRRKDHRVAIAPIHCADELTEYEMQTEAADIARAQALFQEGLALHQSGKTAEAQEIYRRVLEMHPQNFDALHMLGVIALQAKSFAEATKLIDRAIAIDPDNRAYAPAYSNRGTALRKLGRHAAALESFDRALALGGGHADIHFNRGNALRDLLRHEEAVESYGKVIAIMPDHAEATYQRGLSLADLGYHQAAADNLMRAVQLDPDNSRVHNALGIALSNINRHEDAGESFLKAIQLRPGYGSAHNNLGNALHALNRLDAALACYDKAIQFDPHLIAAHVSRAATLSDLRRQEDAIESFDKALELNPRFPFLRGARLHAKMYICDWRDIDREIADLVSAVERGEQVTPSWPLLALKDSLAVQRKAAEFWANVRHPLNGALGPIPKYRRHEKIRIGYYSADFYNHATANLTAELFERHDKSKFEIFAFSFGPNRGDEMQKRIAAAFDTFIDVRAYSDVDVAALSRQHEIDIAVDLKGYTQDNRAGIFACGAAPVQVNYLGYPGTMAARYIDYIVADATVIPENSARYYTEKVVTLPNSYQVNDAHRRIADMVFTRKDLGLPDTGFVFCCFNNNFKITPGTFDVWMRILKRVDSSVLWLFEDNATAAANLRKEALCRGIEAERLVFAPRMATPAHLARQRMADLFLDTLPYNAHTTASDALWVGLPVLTCMGEGFAGRVAASLLKAVNMPELITSTYADYETLAVALATDAPRLAQIKKSLELNRPTAPLFDAGLFTMHLENAYTQMFERYHTLLPPRPIIVSAKK